MDRIDIRDDPEIRRKLEEQDRECDELYRESLPKRKMKITNHAEAHVERIFLLACMLLLTFAVIASATHPQTIVKVINNSSTNNTLVREMPIYDVRQEYTTQNTCSPVSPSPTSCWTCGGQFYYGYQNITIEQFKDNCNAMRKILELN